MVVARPAVRSTIVESVETMKITETITAIVIVTIIFDSTSLLN